MILFFDSPDVTLEAAGGKGVNLSRTAQAGFPVPVGFIITTVAYQTFVEANHLEEHILRLCSSASPADPTSLEAVSQAIGQLFEQGTIPFRSSCWYTAWLCQPLSGDRRYTPLAVRSSATAEDLPGASFAGQQETFLNVRGETALLDAVKRCWSSLWTARALAYRARQGIDPSTVRLAVVVQQIIAADAAGVMFTVNPVTGMRDEVVINAAWGLGEAIVGGLVTPDQIIADKATGTIKVFTLAEKSFSSEVYRLHCCWSCCLLAGLRLAETAWVMRI